MASIWLKPMHHLFYTTAKAVANIQNYLGTASYQTINGVRDHRRRRRDRRRHDRRRRVG